MHVQIVRLVKPRRRTVIVLRVGGGYLIIAKDGCGTLVDDIELERTERVSRYKPRVDVIVSGPGLYDRGSSGETTCVC